MKLLSALALGLVLLTTHVGNATAAMRITFDPGGIVMDYIDKYNAIRLSGGSVIVDGPCISACTLVTGLVEYFCITPRASMGFHSASEVSPLTGKKYDADFTQILWAQYPESIKALLRAKGWDGTKEQPTLIFLTYAELQPLFPTCGYSD